MGTITIRTSTGPITIKAQEEQRVRLTVGSAPLRITSESVGIAGPTGPAGSNGLSAYEIAVANGFSGTMAEWLQSLRNDPEWGDTAW